MRTNAKDTLFPIKFFLGLYCGWGALGAYSGIQWYNYNYDERSKYLRLPSSVCKYDIGECAKCSLKELTLYMNPDTIAYTVYRELNGRK